MSCLKGEQVDGPPRSLYQRDEGELMDGINMIGKARLVSASPFRASVKLEGGARLLNEGSDNDSDDGQFERED